MPHIHRDIDFTVEVYVVYKEKVLLRLHDKYHQWFPPGGHIELDENPNQAAIREVREETGLEVTLIAPPWFHEQPHDTSTPLIPPMAMDIHPIFCLDHPHRHISFAYAALATSDILTPQTTSDVSHSFLWLNKAEVEKKVDLFETIRFYAKNALDIPYPQV